MREGRLVSGGSQDERTPDTGSASARAGASGASSAAGEAPGSSITSSSSDALRTSSASGATPIASGAAGTSRTSGASSTPGTSRTPAAPSVSVAPGAAPTRAPLGSAGPGGRLLVCLWFLAAPLLVLAVLCAAFALRGIFPFGDLSVSASDMEVQYIGFFGWLSRVMHGQGSLFYSFSQGMGEGTAALLAYYLTSPLNLLAWFFTPETMPELMSWLTLIKLPLMALTCSVFLRERHGRGLMPVLLAASYGLCGWAVAECSNIMWLDGAIMLPLVALGTWRLVGEGRCGTLFASVACAVAFNWYTGYMTCLFSVVYFFWCWADGHGKLRRRADGHGKPRRRAAGHGHSTRLKSAASHPFLRVGLCYAATMLLALGASLVVFLPAVLGLLGTKEGGSTTVLDALDLHFSYYPWNLPSSLALTTRPLTDWDIVPPLWVPSLVVALASAALANRRAPRRGRVLVLLAVLAVGATVCVSPLDVAWSGFKGATSFFFRYAFVGCFVLTCVAAWGWRWLADAEMGERRRALALGVGVSAAEIAGSWLATRLADKTHADAWALGLTLVLLVTSAALAEAWIGRRGVAAVPPADPLPAVPTATHLGSSPAAPPAGSCAATTAPADGGPAGTSSLASLAPASRPHSLAPLALCLLVAIELCVNAWAVFGRYGRGVEEWGAYVSDLAAVYDQAPAQPDGLRVGQAGYGFKGTGAGRATTSEGFVLGASGMSEYTSTQAAPMVDLLVRLGYSGANEIFGYYYNTPQEVPDALLGVDYAIVSGQYPRTERVGSADAWRWKGFSLLRNELALPGAYGIRAGSGEIAWPEATFDNQALLERPELRKVWQGFAPVRDPFANQAAMLADMTGEDASGLYAAPAMSERTDLAGEDSRTWTVTVAQDGPVYLYAPMASLLSQPALVSVDGEVVQHVGGTFDSSVMYLGARRAGDSFEVTLSTDDGVSAAKLEVAREVLATSSADDLLCVRTLDEGRFDELRAALDQGFATVEAWEDGHVRLSTSAEGAETLLTVIPYDAGWNATVDGEPVPVRALYGGLCGVDVPAGQHEVELTYETPGLRAGMVGSVVSVGTFVAWRSVARHRRRA